MYDPKNKDENNNVDGETLEEDLKNSLDLDKSNGNNIKKIHNIQNLMSKEHFKAHYEELMKLEDIVKKYKNEGGNIICFFDIQGVLIQNNNYHEALASNKFEEILKDLCIKRKENYLNIARFGRFYNSKLTEEFLPIILNSLADINVELCLLTFARYSKDRENALRTHGILDYFEKQIWTGGISKGVVMMEYLKSKKDIGPLKILFVDDKVTHLQSVYYAVNRENKNNNIVIEELKLFLYNQNPVLTVTEEDFYKFWDKIITQYQKTKYMVNKNRW